ncbi:amine oxidase [copper-containing], partial [Biomphalaria pfeifferi]
MELIRSSAYLAANFYPVTVNVPMVKRGRKQFSDLTNLLKQPERCDTQSQCRHHGV